ncbi:MAG TPA: hypothetical protein VKZ79_16870 [Alphaproteobacteria bacterium]|nr:hypothetical protein [Alphaproteobacteria bacterium]
MKCLLLAAESGDAGSQFNLGMVYDNGLDDNHRPGRGNRAEAIAWLLKAARQGLPRAQSKLAELYADGPDAPKHDIRAHAWFTLAARQSAGVSRHRAECGYKRIESRMTQAQISTAARLVRDWVPKLQIEATTPATASDL